MEYLVDESFLGELRSLVGGWREVMNSLLSSIHPMICFRIDGSPVNFKERNYLSQIAAEHPAAELRRIQDNKIYMYIA